MDIHLGTLTFLPLNDHFELLIEPVSKVLKKLSGTNRVGVAEIDPNFSDTATFCEYYQVEMNQTTNCVVLEAKRGERTWFAACVIFGNTRTDVNGLARRTLDARGYRLHQWNKR